MNRFILFVIVISVLSIIREASAQSDEEVEQLANETQEVLDTGISSDLYRTAHEDDEHVCNSKARSEQEPQLAEYCSAAELAEEAEQKNTTLHYVHLGAAVICGSACAANLICTAKYKAATAVAGTPAAPAAIATAVTACTWSNGLKISCSAASLGGVAADIIVTEEVASAGAGLVGAITSVSQLEGSFAATGITSLDESATTSAVSSADTNAGTSTGLNGRQASAYNSGNQAGTQKVAACMPFVTETLNTVMKKKAADQNKVTAEENYALAEALVAGKENNISISRGSAQDLSRKPGGSGISARTNTATARSAVGSDSSCGVARRTGDITAQVQCASSLDPTTAERLLDPRFRRDFRNASGLGLDDFLNASNHDSTGGSIGRGLAKATNGNTAAISNAVDQYEANVRAANPIRRLASVYHSGGSRRGGDDHFDDALGGALQGLINGMVPKNAQQQASPKSLQFRMKRSKETIERDRDLSLFDRVSYRYRSNQRNLARVPWKSAYNREVAGGPQ